MKTLLHICCAPCSIECISTLRGEGIEPTGFWYNPNIHPYTEYRNRHDALQTYAKNIEMELVDAAGYGLRPFLEALAGDVDSRCGTCYAMRMEATAAYAAKAGFDSFTTTLLISPYQRHEDIKAAATHAAEEYGVAFLYRDFRPAFREGQKKARETGLYMQKYCGCIFSEEERYARKKGQ
ncbi:epoxyqueuosine reductase QueH [Eubacteriales bacterium OttesenSCG-928-A19]|nr:epoxyqueuosine reductase QueH [Eubacteriales bacterium OttesenSCG-928-A19]